MARDDKQASAAEVLGQGRWDVMSKLEAISKQLAHHEMLLKQMEDVAAHRHRDLTRHFNGLASMIAALPSEFRVKLPIGSLLISPALELTEEERRLLEHQKTLRHGAW